MPVIAKYNDIEVEVLSVNKELGVSAVKAVNCEPWPTYTRPDWTRQLLQTQDGPQRQPVGHEYHPYLGTCDLAVMRCRISNDTKWHLATTRK
jgi:hypothetical protein